MKQGNNFIVSADINYDLDLVEYIDFIFVQDDIREIVKYPSTSAIRKQSTNTIQIYWDYHTTYLFSPNKYIKMDTHIKLTDSDIPPQTSISNFRLSPTLFTEYQIVNGMVQDPIEGDDPPRIIEVWVDTLNTYKTQAAASAQAAATSASNAADSATAAANSALNLSEAIGKISQVEEKLSTKQDVISDLETIRQGAALGATSIQDISSKQDVIEDLQAIRSGAALGATAIQDVSDKQNVISDLQEIRQNAAKGATALQEVPNTYRTAVEQDQIHDSTKQDVINDLANIRSKANSALQSYTQTDPTVPSWAKAATKPTYTASEVGALPDSTVIPVVPMNVSAFVNDAGYAKTIEIPTKVSQLTNDSGYINDVSGKADVGDCYTKSESDSKYITEHQSLIGYATEFYVDNKVSSLVNSAPQTLDTLKQLSDALGGDANFATTVANQIGNKQDKLVSGENVKTINGISIMGEGNIIIGDSIQQDPDDETGGIVTDYMTQEFSSIYMTSSNGNKYKLSIDNNGLLSISQI